MPWSVSKSDRCPASRPWAVTKDDDGSLEGCHSTQAEANQQLAALNANENSASGEHMDLQVATRAGVPPREDLLRTAPFALRAAGDPDNDGRTLDGYAAVFGRETIIDSWEGRFREKLALGSMKKSFRETRPRIQFDHGRHPLIGSIPIAKPADGYPREDSDPELAPEGGAHIIARLESNWLIEPVRDAIASEAIDGMSFRFSVVRDSWTDAGGNQIRDIDTLIDALQRTWIEDVPDRELLLRELREVKVPEMGPVVWPAYSDTSVGVRSQTVIDLGALDDPETRKTLARAVFIADAAERMTDGDTPPTTEEQSSAGEHEDPAATEDEPRTTDDDSAGEHSSMHEDQTEPVPSERHLRFSGDLREPADWYLPGPSEVL